MARSGARPPSPAGPPGSEPGLRQAAGGSRFPSVRGRGRRSLLLSGLACLVLSPHSRVSRVRLTRRSRGAEPGSESHASAALRFVVLHLANARPASRRGPHGGRAPPTARSRRHARLVWALPRSAGGAAVTCVNTQVWRASEETAADSEGLEGRASAYPES